MGTLAAPLAIGQTSTNAVHANDLGNTYTIGNGVYRLVKATAQITTPASQVLTTAVSSGVPTWSVGTSTTAGDPNPAGVVPASLTATIPAGAYFLLQVSGPSTIIASATLTINSLIGTSTTGGSVGTASVTAGVSGIGTIQVAGAAATAAACVLKGLI